MRCDSHGCGADAVAVLAFRGMPGHVHVCAGHEAVDREWADVIASSPMPCPAGCAETALPQYCATPPLLT